MKRARTWSGRAWIPRLLRCGQRKTSYYFNTRMITSRILIMSNEKPWTLIENKTGGQGTTGRDQKEKGRGGVSVPSLHTSTIHAHLACEDDWAFTTLYSQHLSEVGGSSCFSWMSLAYAGTLVPLSTKGLWPCNRGGSWFSLKRSSQFFKALDYDMVCHVGIHVDFSFMIISLDPSPSCVEWIWMVSDFSTNERV